MLCLKCFYPPTRLYGVTTQKTIISGAFFLRIVLSYGCSNFDCKVGESGSPFHYSVSHFTFILLQKCIRNCAVSFVLHVIVAKRQRVGVSRSLLYETMAVRHCNE